MKTKTCVALTGVACALGLVFSSAVLAQAYPSKTVRIIVPYPAGGGNDIIARMVAQRLTDTLGQQFIVENRPGAGGSIGMDAVAKSTPDGHTLLVAPNNLAIVPALFAKIPFDPIKDFAPVIGIVNSPGMVAVHSAVSAKTFQELVALVKAQPGKLNYTSCGTASPQHLAGELMKSMVGLDMQHVPYAGCAPSVTDAAAGRVEIIIGTVGNIMPHHKAGRLRALVTTGAKRSDVAPEFPTVAESGVPGYEADVWFAMFAPAKTPRDAVMRLNGEINKLLSATDFRERLRTLNFEPRGGTPEDLGKTVANDLARWGKVVRDVGIKAE